MRHARFLFFLIALYALNAGDALADTDSRSRCVADCTLGKRQDEYLYHYCFSKCGYATPDLPKHPRIDFTCVQNCMAKRYSYQYCTQACSY